MEKTVVNNWLVS